MQRFVIILTLVAIGVWLGLKLSVSQNWISDTPSFSIEILLLLFITTLVIYYKLIRVKEGSFVQLYLLSMAVKIVAYASFNLIMVLKDKPGALGNVLFFMLIYALFTVLEITFLYRRFSAS